MIQWEEQYQAQTSDTVLSEGFTRKERCFSVTPINGLQARRGVEEWHYLLKKGSQLTLSTQQKSGEAGQPRLENS